MGKDFHILVEIRENTTRRRAIKASFAKLLASAPPRLILAMAALPWCVAACDGARLDAKKSSTAPKQAGAMPGPFAITGPSAPVATATPTLSWGESAGAAAFRVAVSRNADCAAFVQDPVDVSATSLVLPPLPDGVHHACVSAINAAGAKAAENNGAAFAVKTTPPGPFAIKEPSAPTNQSAPTVAWEAADTAVSYRLVIGAKACEPALQTHDVEATEKKLAPMADGDYVACVTALDAAGNARSAANNVFPVAIRSAPPGAFAITGPVPPVSPTPFVAWQSAPGAVAYDLIIAADAACAMALRSHRGLVAQSQALAALPPGTYHACVRAKSATGSVAKASNDGFAFTVAKPPQVTGVSPAKAGRFGGAIVTVTGADFASDATVTIGGVTCRDVTVSSPTSLTCVSPAHAVGEADVTVAHADGQESTLANAFTFQSFLYVANYDSADITGYAVDPGTGSLTTIPGGPFPTAHHPGAMTKDTLGRFLFVSNSEADTISAYAIDPATGALSRAPGGDVASGGAWPAAGAVDPAGKRLYMPNFWGGNMAIFSIDPTSGQLTPLPGSPFNNGLGNPQYPYIDPKGEFMYLPESGGNRVKLLRIDEATGHLTASGATYPAGSNVAQVVSHPSGSFFYAPNLLGHSIAAFAADPVTHDLTPVPGSPYPADDNWVGPIAVTADGQFVYNVLYDSSVILGFRVDPASGALSPLAGSPFATSAKPGEVVVDTRGAFLYVTADATHHIIAYRIDPVTGALTPITGSPFPAGTNPGSLILF